MQQTIDHLKHQFTSELKSAKSAADIESLKVKYLGKKGPIQDLMKGLKDVSAESRPAVGKVINDLKVYATESLETQLIAFIENEEEQRLATEKIDVTLPGRRRYIGRKHIVTQALDEMIDIAISMGFSVQYGPDIDTDYYNFEALNFAADHPARDMQDTFYISPNVLLRTHTSNIQARIMETERPPIRIAAPGRVCLLYTSPSPRDGLLSRMPSSA